MTDREMIEAACASQGLTIQTWGEDEDGAYAALGRWCVVRDDYEDRGIYIDTEGELRASVVGAEEYHNRRVHFGFMEDGTDGANEVPDLTVLDAVA